MPNKTALMAAARLLCVPSLALEPQLSRSCWREYRGLDPATRNARFAAAYSEAYKDMTRQTVDIGLSEKVTGIDLSLFLHVTSGSDAIKDRAGRIASVNEARQYADEHGLPYRPFIKFCMNFVERRGGRIPSPNQLLSNKFRKPFEKALAAYKADHLPILDGSFSASNPDFKEAEHVGCYGVPGARAPEADPCRSCPLTIRCRNIARHILEELSVIECQTGKPQLFDNKRRVKSKARNERDTAAARDRRSSMTAEERAAYRAKRSEIEKNSKEKRNALLKSKAAVTI